MLNKNVHVGGGKEEGQGMAIRGTPFVYLHFARTRLIY